MSASHKLTELTPSLQTANAGDLMYIVTDPTGSPESNSITIKNIFESNVTANVVANGSLVVSQSVVGNVIVVNYDQTPANSTNVPSGFANNTLWSDGTYIYIVTSPTSLKRLLASTW